MGLAYRSRKVVAVVLAIVMIASYFGMVPTRTSAATTKVVLVGNLQMALGHTSNWDPDAGATQMTDMGNGTYRFTGTLPAGAYEYKVALNGNWDVSYGNGNYTKPGKAAGDNITLTLAEDSEVTFYYNDKTHNIADSTYYLPIAADKLPRVVGSLQTELGEAGDWAPDKANHTLTDDNFDSVYSATYTVPAGSYEFKIVLGSDWGTSSAYPGSNFTLDLPEDLPVTFTYDKATNAVDAQFTVPDDSGSPDEPRNLRVHYNRPAGDYEGQGLWLFHDVVTSSPDPFPDNATPFPDGQTDSYGAYVDIPIKADAKKVGIVVVKSSGDGKGTKDGGDKVVTITSPLMNEIWIKQGSDTVSPYEPVVIAPNTVRIHYTRSDNNYTDLGLWLWGDVVTASEDTGLGWPTGATPFQGEDRYGAYLDVPLKAGGKNVNFIVVNRNGPGVKDGDNKTFALADQFNQLWIVQANNNVYISPYKELPVGLVSADVVTPSKLLLTFTQTTGFNDAAFKNALTIKDSGGADVTINSATVMPDNKTVEVEASFDLNKLPLNVAFFSSTATAAAGWRMLDNLYAYDGNDLGATYSDFNADFKLWAPKATKVVLKLYDKLDPTDLVGNFDLTKGDQGVWSKHLTAAEAGVGDLKGYYYQYAVTNDGIEKVVLDPYAKSMATFQVNTKGEVGPDGDAVGKAAIVDLSGTDPSGFDYADIAGYTQREDAIIYETHIRDFTADPSIADDLNARWGSYKAFEDKLDYIKSLGVTHIQLMPVMAWYYGDETKAGVREPGYDTKDNEYNWGYDPHNYFSPDGAYSENPSDPELRIKELKGLIHAIHEKGMGVVLDVVYTHMAKKEFLNDIVPNYYAFQDANGNFLGGFGNNLATSHKMAEKLMVDSVKYWFDEYKVDGMRWDMMGDATYESVQDAYDAAAQINPNALFIGEGWNTFSADKADPALKDHGATQAWMDKTDDVGTFSDEFRNVLKSGYPGEGTPNFLTGGARDIQTLLNNIKAQPSNATDDDPGDTVQYIEAHDNQTLHDIIAYSIKKDPSVEANELEIHKRIRLGNLFVMTSQGTAFMQSGQEYGRTKQWLAAGEPEQKYAELKDGSTTLAYFINDSYDSTDGINQFDWAKATDAVQYPVNNATREYTAGLAALRKSTDAFRLGDKALVDTNVTLLPNTGIADADLAIGYKNKSTDGTGNYYVFVNADTVQRTLSLSEDLTSGTVVVDNDEAGTTAVTAPSGFTLAQDEITLDPLSAVIIRMDAAAPDLDSIELDSTEYTLAIDSAHQTTAYAEFADDSRRTITKLAQYVSSKPSIATVTSGGKVQALRAGTTVITVSWGGVSKDIAVTVLAKDAKRYVKFNYIRPDKNYSGWNVWVWNTGKKVDQIDFTSFQNGIASVEIEIDPRAVGFGFKLRKGSDWATAQVDLPDDRFVPVAPGVNYAVVNVTTKVKELEMYPSISGPVLEDGGVTFYYRDDALFSKNTDQRDVISGVAVKVNGTEYPLTYDAGKQLFSYHMDNLAVGTYEYKYLVSWYGITEEMNDPWNTVSGQSRFDYRAPTFTISSSLEPTAIASNESGVLKVQVESSEPGTRIRSGYLDLTALGGPAKVPFDTTLMQQSISVKETVSAGVKNVPVTLVDEYGNKHTHVASVNVKAKTSVGGSLDFDWDEARIYFALTDRFEDGDYDNNANVDKSQMRAYHGGDFEGMKEKLPYLKELGINTLWITPIVDQIDFNNGPDSNNKQYGFHGYWTKDFTQLDEHLGDLDSFKALIDEAHNQGIKIMVDVVLGHVGYGLKPGDNKDTITQADKDRFAGMLRTDGLSSDINPVLGEIAGLPDLKTEDPAVRAKIIEWQTGWLERATTDRGDTIDFFRVDTVKHVEDTTWKAFKNALTALDPSFKLIGENFGGSINNDGGYLRSGQMDGLLDFDFNEIARDFVNGNIDAVNAYLADRETRMDNTTTMGQFLSSHDEDGFLASYAGGDKGKLKVAAALQITAKGQPVIYYGEELGQSALKDNDANRADMPWNLIEPGHEDPVAKALHDHYAKLLNIRAKYSKVYSKGTRTKLAGSDALGYLAFDKRYGNQSVVTIINTTASVKPITIPVPFGTGTQVKDEYSGTSYNVSMSRTVTLDLPSRNDGGTVILSGTLADAPVVPSTSGGNTGTPTGDATITSDMLKGGTGGQVEVNLASGTDKVTLPIDSARTLGTNDLHMKAGGVAITLPHEVLESLRSLLPSSNSTGASINFEFKSLSAVQTNDAVKGANANGANVKPASKVYEFKLSVVTKGGQTIPLTTFDQPIVLSFDVSEGANRDLLGVYYLGADGKLEYVGGTLGGSTMTAEVHHFSSYAVLEYDKSYEDVGASHWANAAVKELSAKHIVAGVSETRFAPDRTITRAEFAAMLVRALGVKVEDGTTKFADVDSKKWYAAYVATASKLGIIHGRTEKVFAPEATISREEMAVMIVRALDAKNGQTVRKTNAGTAFSDQERISKWAIPYVDTAAALGLVNGKGKGAFDPQGKLTRAEGAQVVYQFLKP